MPEYCHYMRDGKGKYVFIPQCVGGGVKGPEGCTCLTPDQRLSIMEKRLQTIAKRLAMIEDWIERNDPDNPMVYPILEAMNNIEGERAGDGKLFTLTGTEHEIDPHDDIRKEDTEQGGSHGE